jgi:hypothetical protein
LALPQIVYIGASKVETDLFHPGYLITNLTTKNFVNYWFLNLGIVSVLAPMGFYFANKKQRKIFIPFLLLFVVGNLFQFSPEIAANHKFFNLFVIGANMFAAYFVVRMWNSKIIGKFAAPVLVFLMVFSGIIDIFPIFNDYFITIEDIPNNKTATFIYNTTPKDSVFLNSSYLYYPANLAGRKIYMGWPYFAWSAGYDTNERGNKMTEFYSSRNKEFQCRFLEEEAIDYFSTEDSSRDRDFPNIDIDYFRENFDSVYENSGFSIYDTYENCQ